MAVMIGSMIIWGIQPGPSLFTNHPEMVGPHRRDHDHGNGNHRRNQPRVHQGHDEAAVLPVAPLWAIIIIYCMVGTYATTNSIVTVMTMTVFGVVGLVMKRVGIPAGPVVLALLLGPLAESNLRRARHRRPGDARLELDLHR